MTSDKGNLEKIRSLIPLYVREILSPEEKEEVENAIVDSPDLQKELQEWKDIYKAYRVKEAITPAPSANLYSKILRKIEEEQETFFEKLKQIFSGLSLRPAFSMAVITAQLFIIIFGGAYLISQKEKYRTLTAPDTVQTDLVRINVIFKEDATEQEIRRFLLDEKAKILDGPYASGLYVIGVPSGANMEDLLDRFKRSKITTLSEKGY